MTPIFQLASFLFLGFIPANEEWFTPLVPEKALKLPAKMVVQKAVARTKGRG
jgi:hypothetical protein